MRSLDSFSFGERELILDTVLPGKEIQTIGGQIILNSNYLSQTLNGNTRLIWFPEKLSPTVTAVPLHETYRLGDILSYE